MDKRKTLLKPAALVFVLTMITSQFSVAADRIVDISNLGSNTAIQEAIQASIDTNVTVTVTGTRKGITGDIKLHLPASNGMDWEAAYSSTGGIIITGDPSGSTGSIRIMGTLERTGNSGSVLTLSKGANKIRVEIRSNGRVTTHSGNTSPLIRHE